MSTYIEDNRKVTTHRLVEMKARNEKIAMLTAYDYSADVNVSGDFQIVITNLSPSAVADSNKDRYAIWALNWTKME